MYLLLSPFRDVVFLTIGTPGSALEAGCCHYVETSEDCYEMMAGRSYLEQFFFLYV